MTQAEKEFIKTPHDVAEVLNFSIVETCAHWSDLYTGNSRYAIEILTKYDYEAFEELREELGIEGEYVELCNRDGAHHHTVNTRVRSFEEYKEVVEEHFNGNNYFYRSLETEEESFLDNLKYCNSVKDVRKELDRLDDYIETPGYYDCNDVCCMSDADLNDGDFSGYRWDVYSYQFGFKFSHNHKLKDND